MSEVFDLCRSINGRCGCQETGARGCSSIIEMVENEETAEDETQRIEQERQDAEQKD